MNILDNFSESFETVLGQKTFKFFDADPDPDPGRGSGIRNLFQSGSGIWDPGWKSMIRYKHPGSETLPLRMTIGFTR
jgi:hypothetical protein